MNRDSLNKFIYQVEKMMQMSDENEIVCDGAGNYLKVSYLEQLIMEARELIDHGESKIALENMLENMYEVSILLNVHTANLARQAFGEEITESMERLLNMLTE